jgi:hypothetical protein
MGFFRYRTTLHKLDNKSNNNNNNNNNNVCNSNFIRTHCSTRIVGQKLSGRPGDPDYEKIVIENPEMKTLLNLPRYKDRKV